MGATWGVGISMGSGVWGRVVRREVGGSYTEAVLEVHAADREGLEELGYWLAVGLGAGGCSRRRVLGRGEVGEARCGLNVDVWKHCHLEGPVRRMY